MGEDVQETRSLALTPTWSVATVLTIFIVVSLLVDRSIHRLSNWLRKTNRKPLLEALEKMREELMLLGFISLLLTATSGMIANICIPSKFYNSAFAPCTRSEIDEEIYVSYYAVHLSAKLVLTGNFGAIFASKPLPIITVILYYVFFDFHRIDQFGILSLQVKYVVSSISGK